MSGLMTKTIELAGAYRGRTVTINDYLFKNGRLTLTGRAEEVENVCRFMERCYQAFPIGDPRIERVNKLRIAVEEEKAHGQHDVHPGEGSGNSEEVQNPVLENGPGTTETDEHDGGGAGEAEVGAEGTVPVGDGHTDPRVPPTTEGPDEKRIREAVASLDPENDDHWTKAGLPAIAAVETLLGSGGVTREVIVNVADGYTREVAAEAPEGEENAEDRNDD